MADPASLAQTAGELAGNAQTLAQNLDNLAQQLANAAAAGRCMPARRSSSS
jgi:hypothetical protein